MRESPYTLDGKEVKVRRVREGESGWKVIFVTIELFPLAVPFDLLTSP